MICVESGEYFTGKGMNPATFSRVCLDIGQAVVRVFRKLVASDLDMPLSMLVIGAVSY